MVQDLFFQREAGELLHLHQLEVDGRHIGTALGLDGDHVGDVEHDQRFPHGSPADAQLLGQFMVVQFITGFQFHGDDPAADGLIGRFPGAPYCHRTLAPSALHRAFVLLIYQYQTKFILPHTAVRRQLEKLPKSREFLLVQPVAFSRGRRVRRPTRRPGPARRPHPRPSAVW